MKDGVEEKRQRAGSNVGQQGRRKARVAAVMACHNRREKTLACLRSLRAQRVSDVSVDTYVVDDGSSDGTADAVLTEFPEVTLLYGDGNLYWAASMRLGLARAFARNYDFYLWLNDDAELDRGALATLLSTYDQVTAQKDTPAIIAGSTRDGETGEVTYGGRQRPSRWRPNRFVVIEPKDEPQPAETMNGNVVLVPRAVARSVGNLTAYRHSCADQDYGLRARQAGFSVWITPGTVAVCEANPEPVYGRSYGKYSIRKELRDLFGIKGLLPSDWIRYSRRWHGPLWPLWCAGPYVRGTVDILITHGRKAVRRAAANLGQSR